MVDIVKNFEELLLRIKKKDIKITKLKKNQILITVIYIILFIYANYELHSGMSIVCNVCNLEV